MKVDSFYTVDKEPVNNLFSDEREFETLFLENSREGCPFGGADRLNGKATIVQEDHLFQRGDVFDGLQRERPWKDLQISNIHLEPARFLGGRVWVGLSDNLHQPAIAGGLMLE